MASNRDKNRFRKTYNFIRRKPQFEGVPDDVLIESGEVIVTAADEATYTFTKVFSSAPFVTATAYDSNTNDEANVNVYIKSVSTTSVKLGTSAAFTGKIHVQAIAVTA
tara:strand:- start:664 stop:987 length:324 start_codon:yes stop_codon:yes gene_type:complete